MICVLLRPFGAVNTTSYHLMKLYGKCDSKQLPIYTPSRHRATLVLNWSHVSGHLHKYGKKSGRVAEVDTCPHPGLQSFNFVFYY